MEIGRRIGWATVGLCLVAGGAFGGPPPADLVLRGGKVATLDSERPLAEAVAVAGGRIVAVGSDEEIASWIGEQTEVVALAGRLVVPGLIEGHGHFLGLGEAKSQLDLSRARSWDEIVASVAAAAAAAPPGEWILGRGWHQEKWAAVPQPNVDGVPAHDGLSAVSPANPVLLTHASGHAAFANARALALAGIDERSSNPAGGEIVRDAAGRPTGLLRETAADLVERALAAVRARRGAAEREAETRRFIARAGEEALRHGITAFHDAGASFELIDLYRRMAEERALPLRLYVMVSGPQARAEPERLARARVVGAGGGWLTVRAIKEYADGALGSHGAWLLAPYADLASSSGLPTVPTSTLTETARLALRHGYQLATHAIGDRANREVLDLYEAVLRGAPAGPQARWRIEHAQHLDPADVPRFAKLGVIAAMQPVHATSDGPWVPKRLGEERARRTSYVWRSLLDAGAVVASGTDVPVEPIDPIANFAAAVTRRMADGRAFFPEQRMTRQEALRSLTAANAYAAFAERELGSVAVGMFADLAVLSHDLLAVADDQLAATRVDLTLLAGKIVYRR